MPATGTALEAPLPHSCPGWPAPAPPRPAAACHLLSPQRSWSCPCCTGNLELSASALQALDDLSGAISIANKESDDSGMVRAEVRGTLAARSRGVHTLHGSIPNLPLHP